jgi:hypothetical protein
MTSIKNGDNTSEEYDKSLKLEVTNRKDSLLSWNISSYSKLKNLIDNA